VAVLDEDPPGGVPEIEQEHVDANVVGQSGTAMPTRYVVTSPPTNSSGQVKAAATTATRCGPLR
jgi:hypothetical protein